jgi:hypothetical protein
MNVRFIQSGTPSAAARLPVRGDDPEQCGAQSTTWCGFVWRLIFILLMRMQIAILAYVAWLGAGLVSAAMR